MDEIKKLGSRLILGANGPNPHRIVTPRGKEDCTIVLYDDAVPETFSIVLKDRTLEVRAICSYPNYYRMEVAPPFRHVRFINVPTYYTPSEIQPIDVCPWRKKAGCSDGNAPPECDSMDHGDYAEVLKKLARKAPRKLTAGGAKRRDPVRERKLRQLSASLKKATEYYSAVLASCELGLPAVREFDDTMESLVASDLKRKYTAILHVDTLFAERESFAKWAVRFTNGKLQGMLARFPYDLHLKLGASREKVTPALANRLFWVWQACEEQMEVDARSGRSGDDKWIPPNVPIEEIRSVIVFPDGSKVYGREIVERKHDREEAYIIDGYKQRVLQRNDGNGPTEGDGALTYKELSKKTGYSVRTLKQHKKDGIITKNRGPGRLVRFCLVRVKQELAKYGR